MADELKTVDVIMGPYRGNRLTMPTAEADAAVNAHWARDPFSGVAYGEGHEPLSEEDREAALTASRDWATAQWAPPAETPPPPEGGEGETIGGTGRRGYSTRAR